MKKLLIMMFICLFAAPLFAGEVVTTPQDIVITGPLTDQTELLTLTHHYGASPYATIRLHLLSTDGNSVLKAHTVYISNFNVAECSGADEPDDCCTGEGTGTGCAYYSDFVDGYGATMKTRGNTAVWGYIQDNYTTQAK